jgi:Zn-dependent peptidase ImmA (M78 family)
VDQDFRINRQDGTSNREEIEANRFAAELLMPVNLIEHDIDRFDQIDDLAVSWFANRYKVSPQAMQIRLTNLGHMALC